MYIQPMVKVKQLRVNQPISLSSMVQASQRNKSRGQSQEGHSSNTTSAVGASAVGASAIGDVPVANHPNSEMLAAPAFPSQVNLAAAYGQDEKNTER